VVSKAVLRRGIAQFMPATAGHGRQPDDPHQALDGAARLMASYVKKYGNWKDALTAYNAGPGRVGRGLPAETQGYIANIIGGANPKSSGHESSGAGGQTSTASPMSPRPRAPSMRAASRTPRSARSWAACGPARATYRRTPCLPPAC
jgi:hypothetical protein